MSRPAVDVVVPFGAPRDELGTLRGRLARLQLRPGDSVLIVDNTPRRIGEKASTNGSVPVLRAAERRTPGYARNRGAVEGTAEWIVFFDADTEPNEDLLDRYFEPKPDASTALIGGGVQDEPVASNGRPAARYQYWWAGMNQDNTDIIFIKMPVETSSFPQEIVGGRHRFDACEASTRNDNG